MTTPYVPDDLTPWTVKPDWGAGPGDGVTEKLSWKTDVIPSVLNVEQRRRLRNSPRVDMSGLYTVWKRDRQVVDALIMGAADRSYRVPLWWEKYSLTETAPVGTQVLHFNTRHANIAPGTVMMFLGATPFIYECMVVSSISDTQVTLVNPLAQTWPSRSALYVTRKARLADASVDATRMTDAVSQMTLVFEIEEVDDYSAYSAEIISEPFPAFDFRPSMMDSVSYSYRRNFDNLDNETGVRLRRDKATQGFNVFQLDQLMRNRQEYRAFKEKLYFLQGRLQPIRLPTYFNDLEYLPSQTTVPSSTSFAIRRCGLAEYLGGEKQGRSSVSIAFMDGTTVLNRIMDSVVDSDDVETVEFQNPWGRTFTRDDIKRISYSQVVRQDQDDVEILHVSAGDGVATCTTTFTTIAETPRLDTDYEMEFFNGLIRETIDPPPIVSRPPPVVLGATWDPAYVVTGTDPVVSLHNGNKGAIVTAFTGFAVMMGKAYVSSGKWYIELLGNVVTSRNRSGFGYIKAGAAPGPNCVSVDIYQSAIYIGDILKVSGFPAGNHFCYALDMDTKRLWFKSQPSNPWSGEAVRAGNPALGQGGIDISQATGDAPGGALTFFISTSGDSQAKNISTLPATHLGSVPEGFNPGWPLNSL